MIRAAFFRVSLHPRDKAPQTIFFYRDGLKIEVMDTPIDGIFNTILSEMTCQNSTSILRSVPWRNIRDTTKHEMRITRDTQESNHSCVILMYFYIFLSFSFFKLHYFILISRFVWFICIFGKTDYNFDAAISLKTHRLKTLAFSSKQTLTLTYIFITVALMSLLCYSLWCHRWSNATANMIRCERIAMQEGLIGPSRLRMRKNCRFEMSSDYPQMSRSIAQMKRTQRLYKRFN